MLLGKTVAVVVPAYNEQDQIISVLETMPAFVDRIIVVNDCSTDETGARVLDYAKTADQRLSTAESPRNQIDAGRYSQAQIVAEQLNEQEIRFFIPSKVANKTPERDRIIIINQLVNGGVGAAIARGYKWCKDHRIDCTAVMAGDAQMDPAELESICLPVITEGIDYVKGNRLIHRSAWLVVPKVRFIGNSVLTLLTKIASGYWHVSDTQTGYTAISLKALNAIPLYKIYPRYGMPNDMLVKLNIAFCTLREVEIKPVYRIGEKSKMKIWKVMPIISFLLFRLFFKRLWVKYFFRDFHPLFILYHLSFLIGIVTIPIFSMVLKETISGEPYRLSVLILFALLVISGFQCLLFSMWMDIIDNERLHR